MLTIYEMINGLMQYGKDHQLYDPEDKEYIVNALLNVLQLDEYVENDYVYDRNATIVDLLNPIIEYAIREKIIENTQINRDLFDTKIMGCLTPMPSMINRQFALLKEKNPQAATDYFYQLCQDTNYIRMTRIAKDIHFDYPCEYGTLNISINMSKPEKDPNDIKNLLNVRKVDYPKCMLCKENVNYRGRLNFPARQNLRFVPVCLDGKKFYMQYSPYSYYSEHTICFKDEHSNMKVDLDAVKEIVSFVQQFPHYFMGSNAGLPIVGGSILNHHHFQGGRAVLPMENAAEDFIKEQNHVRYFSLRWPMNVIRLRSSSTHSLIEEAGKVFALWSHYNNASLMIIAEDENGEHNAITPICRYQNGQYELDLVLRNNLTTQDRPLGLYHPRSEYWHIKKENIGLIEVMGLAILPSRLKAEMQIVKKYLLNETLSDEEKTALKPHAYWADQLKKEMGSKQIDQLIHDGIGETFKKVLEDCAVFKKDAQDQLKAFILSI